MYHSKITKIIAKKFALAMAFWLISVLAMGSGLTAFAQGAGNPGTASQQANVAPNDATKKNLSDIRLKYAERYRLVRPFLPNTFPDGLDAVDKEGKSQGPGVIIQAAPGEPLFMWPVPVLGPVMSSVPSVRDQGIMQNKLTATGYPLSDTQFQMMQRMNQQILLDQIFDPERIMWTVGTMGYIQTQDMANGAANMARNQAASAIDFVARPLCNFTVEQGNEWNRIRNGIFLPMAMLLLLPGAVLAQVRAIVAAGSSVLGDVNPFDGIMRSIVAIFMIPATYLVLNYGIDLNNSITMSIASEYQNMFGSNMYKEAACGVVRAFPIRQVQENRNGIIDPPQEYTQKNNSETTPAAKLESQSTAIKYEDPCAGIFEAPAERADETANMLTAGIRLMMNSSMATMSTLWNMLAAFQFVFLTYLWCVGPIVAALWVYPMNFMRNALGSWLEGVITLCFWSLFWNTTVLLMACFRGVDETGTVIYNALMFLAISCVKYAFDFAGLVRAAGQQAAGQAQGLASQMSGKAGAAHNAANAGGGARGGGDAGPRAGSGAHGGGALSPAGTGVDGGAGGGMFSGSGVPGATANASGVDGSGNITTAVNASLMPTGALSGGSGGGSFDPAKATGLDSKTDPLGTVSGVAGGADTLGAPPLSSGLADNMNSLAGGQGPVGIGDNALVNSLITPINGTSLQGPAIFTPGGSSVSGMLSAGPGGDSSIHFASNVFNNNALNALSTSNLAALNINASTNPTLFSAMGTGAPQLTNAMAANQMKGFDDTLKKNDNLMADLLKEDPAGAKNLQDLQNNPLTATKAQDLAQNDQIAQQQATQIAGMQQQAMQDRQMQIQQMMSSPEFKNLAERNPQLAQDMQRMVTGYNNTVQEFAKLSADGGFRGGPADILTGNHVVARATADANFVATAVQSYSGPPGATSIPAESYRAYVGNSIDSYNNYSSSFASSASLVAATARTEPTVWHTPTSSPAYAATQTQYASYVDYANNAQSRMVVEPGGGAPSYSSAGAPPVNMTGTGPVPTPYANPSGGEPSYQAYSPGSARSDVYYGGGTTYGAPSPGAPVPAPGYSESNYRSEVPYTGGVPNAGTSAPYNVEPGPGGYTQGTHRADMYYTGGNAPAPEPGHPGYTQGNRQADVYYTGGNAPAPESGHPGYTQGTHRADVYYTGGNAPAPEPGHPGYTQGTHRADMYYTGGNAPAPEPGHPGYTQGTHRADMYYTGSNAPVPEPGIGSGVNAYHAAGFIASHTVNPYSSSSGAPSSYSTYNRASAPPPPQVNIRTPMGDLRITAPRMLGGAVYYPSSSRPSGPPPPIVSQAPRNVGDLMNQLINNGNSRRLIRRRPWIPPEQM